MQPGWPKALVRPDDAGFVDDAVRWLLDAGPGELRTSELRLYPIALASHVRRLIDAEVAATRESYARARSDLGSILPADELRRVQVALEAEGARLLALAREVNLVQQALSDRRN